MGRVGRQKTINARAALGRSSALPPVTVAIIVITTAVFLFGGAFARDFIQDSRLVASGEWWRIFTTVLLHAGLTHILFNMWALYVLGPQVERAVGPWPYLALYLAAAGVGGAVAQFTYSGPFQAVGASGAVFGLFGVWVDLAFRQRKTSYGRSLLNQLGFLLLINAALPFFLPEILWQAHLGGFITGLVVGEVWARIRSPRSQVLKTLAPAVLAVLAAISVVVF